MNSHKPTFACIDEHAPHNQSDLSRIYSQRFQKNLDYRKKVWRILLDDFFSKFMLFNYNINNKLSSCKFYYNYNF